MKKKPIIILVIFLIFLICLFANKKDIFNGSNNLRILSSFENYEVEDELIKYANKNNIKLDFTYMGDLDIVTELNTNSSDYDAVWISNSMWLYMLNDSYLTSDSKSISISPVVVGIKKSLANSLGLVDNDVTNNDILKLIKDKKIKYVMSSVTQTNTGATAYFGFLNSLAGNPEVLTNEMLHDETLISNLIDVFSGVERVSGDENYLKEMFINSQNYEAVIADEASLININKTLIENGEEELHLLYPIDGVAVNDSTFAFINNNENKEDIFLKIQNYLLSEDGQGMLKQEGRRTWYGGVNKDVDNNTFNKKWGIDTSKYLNVTRFPSKDVMTEAFNLYIERLRKPTHVVFCLDYSGSMYGNGVNELKDAMNYILDYESAKKDQLQFSIKDKISIITFSTDVTNIWKTNSGYDTNELINNINNYDVGGSTALYDAIIRGFKILDEESDDYTKTIIAMTDGQINVGSFNEMSSYYRELKSEIPVYSIMFGDAVQSELEDIAYLTNAKVFDGRVNLLQAFKKVRTYN